MTKNNQLKNNEDVFTANQKEFRRQYEQGKISKKQLEQFSRWNSSQFETVRNSIVWSDK